MKTVLLKTFFYVAVFESSRRALDKILFYVLPIYHSNLKRSGLLAKYTFNAAALTHSITATSSAVYCIIFRTWAIPVGSVVYFTMDILIASPSREMIFHHILALFLICLSPQAPLLAPYFLLSEASTIPLTFKVIIQGPPELKRLRLSTEERDLINRLRKLFRLCFVVCRLILIPAALYASFDSLPTASKFGCTSMALLNVAWAVRAAAGKT